MWSPGKLKGIIEDDRVECLPDDEIDRSMAGLLFSTQFNHLGEYINTLVRVDPFLFEKVCSVSVFASER